MSEHASTRRAPTLIFIILVKFGKGLLLLGLAIGAFKMAGQDLQTGYDRMLRLFQFDPTHQFFRGTGQWLHNLDEGTVVWIAAGLVGYSLFTFAEAFGLYYLQNWAAWLAIIESSLFIPVEMYGLRHGFSWLVCVILGLNILIVWYLVQNRHRLFDHPSAGPA